VLSLCCCGMYTLGFKIQCSEEFPKAIKDLQV
jgi:hypothetical protein